APAARRAAAQAPASNPREALEAGSLIVSLPWPFRMGRVATARPRSRGTWSVAPLLSQRRRGAVLVIGGARRGRSRTQRAGRREKSPGSRPGAPLPPDSRQGSRRVATTATLRIE